MAKQLLGKEVTAALNEKIKANVAELQAKGVDPTLCIIRVGENPSDISYERGATKRCETLGVACEKILLPEDVSQDELLATIDKVNKDDSIHGVLLFRPLPKHLDQSVIENALDPAKDVDCMTDGSMSGVFTGKQVGFPPCTPQACMEILDHYGIDCTGKKAVVIGRSLVVGKPAAMMLIKKNATVTVCHTKTVDMPSVAKEADIIIVAAGRAGVVGADYVKAGQVSEFRHDFDMLKCREINDLHHAKDAYLNIVIGNVHDVKFTSNPMNFVKNADKHYTIKVKETLKHKVSRNGETAWNPETDFDTVKRMMSKNSVRYVRYCYKRKGGFFNQNPDRAGNPDLARLKKDLDPVKYGGYNSKSISCFSLIKCTGVGAVIIPVELLCEKRYFSDDSFASEYAYSVLKNALPAKNIAKISIDDISFPLKRRPIKINTLFEFDGYRVNIRSKDSYHYFTISSAMAAIYSKDTSDYIKAVSSYIDKSDKGSKFKPGEAFDVLSNLKVYDEIAKKCISEPFSKINKLAEAGKKMEEGRDKFAELSIIEQMKTLLLLVDVLKTGRINTCNLKPVGGVESYHTERMSAILKNTKYSDIRIIDQSPTGLYEKKSDNLLEL